MKRSFCKKCGAEIKWIKAKTRFGERLHPVNIGPKVVIVTRNGYVNRGLQSHYNTCPFTRRNASHLKPNWATNDFQEKPMENDVQNEKSVPEANAHVNAGGEYGG